jgi:RNA polymerase sigma-70 factor (ECF subfamily)
MLAFQAGDESAFDRLVEAYSGPVYSLLTRFLGTVARREDLVQEVFLRVLRSRERYRPSARFSTWLYRIAFNLCTNEREKRSGHEASLDALGGDGDEGRSEWVDEEAGEPWAALETADVVQAVRTAIDALPERQRMALVLARYEELPYSEIGQVLGVSERAIKSLVHRARERLREMLAPFVQEETA